MATQPRATRFVPTLDLRSADRMPIGMNGHGQVHDPAPAGGRAP